MNITRKNIIGGRLQLSLNVIFMYDCYFKKKEFLPHFLTLYQQ